MGIERIEFCVCEPIKFYNMQIRRILHIQWQKSHMPVNNTEKKCFKLKLNVTGEVPRSLHQRWILCRVDQQQPESLNLNKTNCL